MNRKRYLPEKKTLDALLQAAGVSIEPADSRSQKQENFGGAQPEPLGLNPAPATQQTQPKPEPSPKALPTAKRQKPPSFRFNSSQPMEENLEKFLEWLVIAMPAKGGFVKDSLGLVLASRDAYLDALEGVWDVGDPCPQTLVDAKGKQLGGYHVKLSQNRYLVVVTEETTLGELYFGLIMAKPLYQDRANFIRMVMRKIVG